MTRSLGVLALVLAIAGCSLTPPFERPRVAAPAAWPDGASDAWPAPDWWRGFGSGTLDSLIETARANNTDIAQAAARVLQADAQARIAGAPLLPSLDASADAGRDWQRTATSTTTASGRRSTGTVITNSFGAGLSASYELDFFGRNRAALASALATSEFSRFDQETVALSIVAGVATAYFQVLELRDRLDVARRNLAAAEGVLEVVEARVRDGAASPLELAQQRTQVASQRAAIPTLEAQARQAETALATLLGAAPGGEAVAGVSLLSITPPEVAAGLPSELLQRRPDIQAAETRLVAANAEIGAARAAYFPSVSLTGTYGYDSAIFTTLFDPVNLSYGIGASLLQPIFQGGRIEAGVDLAEARQEELVAAYRKAVLTAFAEVADALVAATKTGEQESLQLDAVDQARLAYGLAETRYRAGLVDLLTVLDAQRTLNQAEDQLVRTRFERLQAAVALYKALGGGWRAPAGR